MKILSILFLAMLLAGCASTTDPKIVYVEVFTPVSIKMPPRPILKSGNLEKELDKTGKNIELDLIDLKGYAMKLETLLEEIQAKSDVINTQNTKIDK